MQTAALWLLFSGLAFALAIVLFFPGHELTGFERFLSATFMLVLAAPLAMQLKAQHSRIREIKANCLALDEIGVRIRLGGSYRAAKGLPVIAETQLRWTDVTMITRERRRFIYPSLIPFAYPLDVYTIVTAGATIPFTSECISGARRAARKIAARLGQEIATPPSKRAADA